MEKPYLTTKQQREALLTYLLANNHITTLEARTKLDILHPAGRIFELRGAGHNIHTYRKQAETPLGKHSIAEYVLLSGGSDE